MLSGKIIIEPIAPKQTRLDDLFACGGKILNTVGKLKKVRESIKVLLSFESFDTRIENACVGYDRLAGQMRLKYLVYWATQSRSYLRYSRFLWGLSHLLVPRHLACAYEPQSLNIVI